MVPNGGYSLKRSDVMMLIENNIKLRLIIIKIIDFINDVMKLCCHFMDFLSQILFVDIATLSPEEG
jgi:hypothetical protein